MHFFARSVNYCPGDLVGIVAVHINTVKASRRCVQIWKTALILSAVVVGFRANGLPANAAELADQLSPLIRAHRGQVSVAIKHLTSGESFEHLSDRPMPTASLIKLPVMVEAYRQAREGQLDLARMLTLREADKVPGSGILTSHFSEGAQISIRDAIRLMIVYSDNTATNLVLDQIGIRSVADTMEKLELPNTKLHAKVFRRDTSIFPERSREFGLGSTTAGEMLRLIEQIYHRRAVSSEASDQMLEHLRNCDDKSTLARNLPKGVKLAHKSGAVTAVRCDAGVMESKAGPIAICLLTNENEDRRWTPENAAEMLGAEIARRTCEHFLARTDTTAEIIDSPLGALVTETPPAPSPDDVNSEKLGTETADSLDGVPFVTCRAWSIADAKTGVVCWGSNVHEQLDMASTTKIMTACLVLQLAQTQSAVLDEEVTFSKAADATIGSTADVREGERLPVRELLYGLMLPSGNDAATALAEHFGLRFATTQENSSSGPSAEPFVSEMNRVARQLGMSNTNYVNPHGLSAKGHRSTAEDLARLAHAALKLPQFRDYIRTRQHGSVVFGPGGYRRNVVWKNTNRLLRIDGYVGMKTGTTDGAGACLVSISQREGDELIAVVLGSTSSDARYADTRNLFRWAWQKRLLK